LRTTRQDSGVTTFTGSWVHVPGRNGSVRRDWVPSEQPPSPDGSAGKWHVVNDLPDATARWEWHPAPAPPAVPVGPRRSRPRVPQDLASNVRRGCTAAVVFGGLMPWATIGPFSITGASINDGKVLMAIGFSALALSLVPRFFLVRLADVLLAIAALLAAILDVGNTSELGSRLGPMFNVEVGSGLVVCVVAAAGWLVLLAWEQARLIGARRRGRYRPPAWYQPAH
jgi:hypothetical protein